MIHLYISVDKWLESVSSCIDLRAKLYGTSLRIITNVRSIRRVPTQLKNEIHLFFSMTLLENTA